MHRKLEKREQEEEWVRAASTWQNSMILFQEKIFSSFEKNKYNGLHVIINRNNLTHNAVGQTLDTNWNDS